MLSCVMTNQFGNYLCQRIIEIADIHTLSLIAHSISQHLVSLSVDLHGTRVVQALIEKLAATIKQENMRAYEERCDVAHQSLNLIIQSLNTSVFELIMDMNGNHVIQTFLMVFKASNHPAADDLPGSELTSQYTEFIFEACMRKPVDLGVHKHGCCVMQRCLEMGCKKQKLALSNHIIENIDYLIEDAYGNYLVQNVIKLEDQERNDRILRQIAKDFIRLSQLKFSSNVIEKCLDSKRNRKID